MGTLADERLRNLVPTIDAYRPAALAVAVVIGLVIVVPGAQEDESPTAEFAAASTTDGGTEAGSAPTSTPAPTTTSPPTTAPTDDAFEPSSPPPTSPPTTDASSSPPTTEASSPSGFSPDDEGADDGDDAGAPEQQPLQVAASGWASTTGGSPLATGSVENVPEGTLPVGTRVDQDDKISFVRLTGDEMQLVLAEDEEGRRGGEFEASPIQACQITDPGWEPGGDQPMSDAPEYDPDNCAPVQLRPDDTWAVSLLLFEDPTDERGLALVPSEDAPLDFQVTLLDEAVAS